MRLPLRQANLLTYPCKSIVTLRQMSLVGITSVLFLGSPLSTTQGINMDKDKEIEALKFTINTIAEIIDMQLPLKYQDRWLEAIKKEGLYDGHDDE